MLEEPQIISPSGSGEVKSFFSEPLGLLGSQWRP